MPGVPLEVLPDAVLGRELDLLVLPRRLPAVPAGQVVLVCVADFEASGDQVRRIVPG